MEETLSLFNGLPEAGTETFDQLIDFCQRNETWVLAALPWVAAEIASDCTFAAMFRTVQDLGGRPLYLPANRHRFNLRTKLALSEDAFGRLVIGSNSKGFVDIPSAWGVFLSLRRTAIYLAVSNGLPDIQIISELGVTQRHLRQIRQGKKLY